MRNINKNCTNELEDPSGVTKISWGFSKIGELKKNPNEKTKTNTKSHHRKSLCLGVNKCKSICERIFPLSKKCQFNLIEI